MATCLLYRGGVVPHDVQLRFMTTARKGANDRRGRECEDGASEQPFDKQGCLPSRRHHALLGKNNLDPSNTALLPTNTSHSLM